jgi:hypothetical protein
MANKKTRKDPAKSKTGANAKSVSPASPRRNVFLWTLIASLSLSALLAIFVFIVGQFGETEVRLLLTTLAVGVYSLTGLCSSSLYDRGRYQVVGAVGIILSIVGFLFALGNVWDIIDLSSTWKALLVLIIVPVSIAHASLLLLIDTKSQLVGSVIRITLGTISVVALLLIYAVFKDFDLDGQTFYRLLGVFAVLDVLGTITSPLLRKTSG